MRRISLEGILWYAVLVVMVVAIGFPIYWMALTAFQPTSVATSYPPTLFFKSFSLEAVWDVLHNSQILRWTMNSVFVSLGVVVLNLLLAVPAAYAIARYRIRLNTVVLFAVLVTQMIPPAILVVPMYEIFAAIGLNNSLLALILADCILTLPLGTWILVGFFENIPREIEEAAIMDGASRMMLFYRISLPLTYPALVTVSILNFYDTWNEYMYAYTFISDQSKWVGTVGIASFMGQFLIDWQAIMSSSVVFSLVPLLFYIFLRNYIIRGVAEGFARSSCLQLVM